MTNCRNIYRIKIVEFFLVKSPPQVLSSISLGYGRAISDAYIHMYIEVDNLDFDNMNVHMTILTSTEDVGSSIFVEVLR
jgi:hypothetical protein